jgi:hypothetical protein
MNVGDIVKVHIDQSFVRGRIIGIPENRGKILYKVEFADLSTIPQWFDAERLSALTTQYSPVGLPYRVSAEESGVECPSVVEPGYRFAEVVGTQSGLSYAGSCRDRDAASSGF